MTAPTRFVVIALALVFAVAAYAQNNKHDSQLKTVRGVVVDKSENPVPSGVVFLKILAPTRCAATLPTIPATSVLAGSIPIRITSCTPKKTARNRRPATFPVSKAAWTSS